MFQHPSCLSYVEFLHSLMTMLHCNVHQGCVALWLSTRVMFDCDVPNG